jgi:hypothetical protein
MGLVFAGIQSGGADFWQEYDLTKNTPDNTQLFAEWTPRLLQGFYFYVRKGGGRTKKASRRA